MHSCIPTIPGAPSSQSAVSHSTLSEIRDQTRASRAPSWRPYVKLGACLKWSTGRVREEGGHGMSTEDSRATKSVLLVVEDNSEDLKMIAHELGKRYGEDYQDVCESSTMAGIKRLRECKAAGGDVALVLADWWVPQMTGAEFLATSTRAPSGCCSYRRGTAQQESPFCGRQRSGRSTTTWSSHGVCPTRRSIGS
jgi:CheY-like chemotaxis protein